MNVIETLGLSKKFGELAAVDKVSISVGEGEIYGFLGLNGAGKTTTIRMLLGMIHPSEGEARVCGRRIEAGRGGPWEKVGHMVETPAAYPQLSVRQNLWAVARLRALDEHNSVSRVIERLGLSSYADVPAKNLSLGNSQRLGLAKALIHEPALLILDEPSNGLDPAGIVEIRELLGVLASEQGVTVLISSHNLSEISRIATRIGIIHKGRLVQEIDAKSLATQLSRSLELDFRDRPGAKSFLDSRGLTAVASASGSLRILDACDADRAALERPEELNGALVHAGFPPLRLNLEEEDLESYFLRVIGAKE